MMKRILVNCFLALFYCMATVASAASDKSDNRHHFENKQLVIRITARSPDQIAAFYEARGFPGNMIARLKNECFMTVGIKNKTRDILWLDLAQWQFSSAGKAVKRYHRNEWTSVWHSLEVPLASQSTFRWTLLPELLDFRPDEREGGNIILERQNGAYTLTARFMSGEDKRGKPVDAIIENIHCAKDRK